MPAGPIAGRGAVVLTVPVWPVLLSMLGLLAGRFVFCPNIRHHGDGLIETVPPEERTISGHRTGRPPQPQYPDGSYTFSRTTR